MAPEHKIKTCCITNCTNTELNSTVVFFTFPVNRYRSFQRNKWVMAIRNNKKNSPWWLPSEHSVVCGAHFVNGQPSTRPQDVDYVPSIFDDVKKPEIKSRTVSVKKFALEYIKHDALLENPSRSNIKTDVRKCAYVKLAASLGITVATARAWERRFREFFEQKMVNSPDKRRPAAGAPQWLVVVAKRLSVNPTHICTHTNRLPAQGRSVSPSRVVKELAAAARSHGTLCSTAMYNDARRSLRICATINDLHAVWVSAQRVSLEQVGVAGRAGDAGQPPPPHAVQVADLVLLHSDVDMHRLVTDESVTLYEESAALHTLWQLVQRHRLEDAAPMNASERARRWTHAHRDYLDSGRVTSLVVLQRRWHELKLQARVRLAAHWRRAAPPPRAPPYPPHYGAPAPAAPPAPLAPPSPPPHELLPRPAPIHISILKRYPHIATGAFKSWRQLVLDGAVVTEPLEPDTNKEETQDKDHTKSPDTTDPPQLDPKVEQSAVVTPKVEQTPNDDHKGDNLIVNEPKIEKVSSELFVDHSSGKEHSAKQTSDKTVDEPIEKTTVNKPLVKESTTGDPLVGLPEVDEPMDTDILDEDSVTDDSSTVKPTVNEDRIDRNDPSTEIRVFEQTMVVEPMDCNNVGEQNATDNPMGVQATVNDVKMEVTIDSDSSATMVDSLALKSTVNEHRIDKNDPSTEIPVAEQAMVVEPMDCDNVGEQNATDDRMGVRATVNDVKIEVTIDSDSSATMVDSLALKSTVNEVKVEPTLDIDHLDNPFAEKPTVDNLIHPSVINVIHSKLLNEKHTKDTSLLCRLLSNESTDTDLSHRSVHNTNSDLSAMKSTVNQPKIEQQMEKELLNKTRTKDDPLGKNPVEHSSTPNVSDTQDRACMANVSDTQDRACMSNVSDTQDRACMSNVSDTQDRACMSNVSDTQDRPSMSNLSDTRDRASMSNVSDTQDRASMSNVLDTQDGACMSYVLDTQDRASMSNVLDTQDRASMSIEQIQCAEDEVIRPNHTQASDTDSDTENNLVIDEGSNNTPCSLNREKIAITEAHSVDTVSLGNTAPTIAVLQMIDPSTVKTEILFDSDEEEFQPHIEEVKVEIELETKEEVSFIADKIRFVDDEAGGSGEVKAECDVTERVDCDAQDPDELDSDNIDSLLLMDTKVLLSRIDKTRAWKNNARKDKSIKFSRIHRRFYTPNPKKYYFTPKSKNKSKTKRNKSSTVTVKPQNYAGTVETNKDTTHSNDSTEYEEIEVNNCLLDKVADAHTVRQYCRNIKREFIEGPHDTPNKRIKTASDTDDEQPLLVLRDNPPSEVEDRDMTETDGASEIDDDDGMRMVEASSSDEEFVNGEIFFNNMWDVKRKARGRSAASTIEWNAELAEALGPPGALGAPGELGAPGAWGRVAKRVTLPDREQLRRDNVGLRVAQVAPITIDTTEAPEDSGTVEPPGQWDAAADDTPFAWRALDLPAADQLETALDELTSASSVEHVLQRSPCCEARRHRDVNDARRRIGIAELPLHTHADGPCSCCCAHLSEAAAYARLDQQLRALHSDIERILGKTAVGRSLSKAVQKHSRSPSPTSTTTATKPTATVTKPTTTTTKQTTTTTKPTTTTTKQTTTTTKPTTTTTKPTTTTTKPTTTTTKSTTKDVSLNIPTEAKSSKTKPATYSNRSKQRRAKPRPATPPLASPSPPVDYYEEWQRQKTMNAQYFHINSPFKKEKTTPQSVAQTTAGQNVAQTTAGQSVAQTITPQSVAQRATRQSVITQSAVANSVTPPQTTQQGGLMPYIRESRLIAPAETRPMITIEVPTLVPVPRGTPARLVALKLPTCSTPALMNTAHTVERTTPRPIAPKPESMRHASKLLNTVKEPETTTKSLTEQVAEPQTSTSQPEDKPLSILEEYSRTLSTEPTNNIPVVNALALRVPDGPERSKTTIVMTVNIPSEDIIKQTINTLYANDTIDLTKETDTSTVKTTEPQKMPPAVDIVAAVKSVINAGTSDRSLLKPSNNTDRRSSLDRRRALKAQLTSLLATSKPRNKAPTLMSLSNKLHDGDVIEIDDTDSSDDSNDSHSSSSILMNKSSNPAVYSNKSSNLAKSSNTKIGNGGTSNTDVFSSQVVAGDTNSCAQTTNGTVYTLNQAIHRNIKNNSKQAAIKTNERLNQASTKTYNPTKYCTIEKTRRTSSNSNDSNQAVSKINEDTSHQSVSETTTSDRAPSNTSNIIQAIGEPRRVMSYKSMRDRIKKKVKMASRLKESQHQGTSGTSTGEAVELNDLPHVQSLQSQKDVSERCWARCANVAALPDFMDKLRASVANMANEVYTHKSPAIQVAAAALACGDTLLCVDGARAPLALPARGSRGAHVAHVAHETHVVLTDADLPCTMPTFWTLAPFPRMSRVVPERVTGLDTPADADGVTGSGLAPGLGGARWCAEKREWVMLKGDKKICDQNHNFKILTAFCTADGVRQAARAGASLYLLHVQRARVLVLSVARVLAGGDVRHRARADVTPNLLRELEELLDEAEIDEQRADQRGSP